MGIDMATYDELIAHSRTVEEIREFIGADSLAYLSHEGMMRRPVAAAEPGHCSACFTGNYPDSAGRVVGTPVRKRSWPSSICGEADL